MEELKYTCIMAGLGSYFKFTSNILQVYTSEQEYISWGGSRNSVANLSEGKMLDFVQGRIWHPFFLIQFAHSHVPKSLKDSLNIQ